MKEHGSQESPTQHWLRRYDIEGLAKESGWAARDSGKLTALEFCSAMAEATRIPNASLRVVAFLSYMASSVSVSKQAIHKRINGRACALFERLLSEVVSDKLEPARPVGALGFRRVIVQDSTSIALAGHLFEDFPGARNAFGQFAGAKVHASFDLVARRFAGFSICEHRRADQGFSLEGVEGFGQGDLLLRDLGYFNLEAFRLLKERGGDILTRWQPRTTLWNPEDGKAIDLRRLLRRGVDAVDRDVLAGDGRRFPMRLVALRVPEQVAEKRRRRVREEARRRKRSPSKELLKLQDWQIYLTTCSREALSLEDVHGLYRQRWAIEILFKAFKSHMRMDRMPPFASARMVRCLVLCSLVRIARAAVVTLPTLDRAREETDISLLKLYSLVEALGGDPGADYFSDRSQLDNFSRHCRYEKRKRTPLPKQLKSLG